VSKRVRKFGRRELIETALASAALGLVFIPARRAEAQQKMTQVQALYQDRPKDGQFCNICTLFQAPNACKIVQGEISPKGWCKAFDMVD
jgi:hypothetical protein